MTRAFTAVRTVGRPPAEVWRVLTDWAHAAVWLGVDSIVADGPTTPGTRLTFWTRGKEQASEIVSVDPGRSVVLRSTQGGVTADYRYAVEPAGTGTRVTLDADVRAAGVWAVAAPLIRLAIRRTDRVQLERLEQRLT